MRLIFALALSAFPATAHAWEFTPGLPCILTHTTAQASIALTYDPTQPLYTLTITRAEPWPEAPTFGMRFEGPQSRAIGTDRHQLSMDGAQLSVADSGFGNVLDGLQYNSTAVAISGDTELRFPLDGAAEPVAAFRACDPALPVS